MARDTKPLFGRLEREAYRQLVAERDELRVQISAALNECVRYQTERDIATAHALALEEMIRSMHSYSKTALDTLQTHPFPTPNYQVYRPLEGALTEILAITHPKDRRP
ncbi:MAG: hypothetical protein LUO93_09545 [Methanomicrobiales archaeon]|nr:hypothetical protein [Methanomicrobiales archaeon]